MIDLVDMRSYKESNDDFCWILSILDVHSKFARTYPLKGKTAEFVVECLEDLFDHYGVPAIIQSDNGKEFRDILMYDLASKHKIFLINGRPRHPQTQGQVERFNQTIIRLLSKQLMNEETSERSERWINYLKKVTNVYNQAVHSATSFNPFKKMFNRVSYNTVVRSYSESENLESLELDIETSAMFVGNEIETVKKKKNLIKTVNF